MTALLATTASAQDELIKNYRGIRQLGMGGVVTTTGLYDEALFNNPAMQLEDPNWKLTILGITAEANTNLFSDLSKLKDVQSASGTGAAQKIAEKGLAGRNEHERLTLLMPAFYSPKFFGENTSFAAGLLINNQTNIMLRANAEVDTQAVVDIGPAFGVGHKFMDGNLNVGLNVRTLYRLAADPSLRAVDFLGGTKISLNSIGGQGIGIDGDLGAYYKIPIEPPFFKKLSVGASLNNIMQSTYRTAGTDIIKSVKGTPFNNDRTFSLGARADLPDLYVMSDSLFALEFQDIGTTRKQASFWKKLHMGAETHVLVKFLSVRAGFNQGYIAAGVGLDFPLFKFDVATYGEELGANTGRIEDRRVAARFAIEI